MKYFYYALCAFVIATPLKAQDVPPFFKEGVVIKFKADGLKMGEYDAFKIMEIKGKWVHLQRDMYGSAPAEMMEIIQKNGASLLADRYSDVGWFSVDKMNNIIEVK